MWSALWQDVQSREYSVASAEVPRSSHVWQQPGCTVLLPDTQASLASAWCLSISGVTWCYDTITPLEAGLDTGGLMPFQCVRLPPVQLAVVPSSCGKLLITSKLSSSSHGKPAAIT